MKRAAERSEEKSAGIKRYKQYNESDDNQSDPATLYGFMNLKACPNQKVFESWLVELFVMEMIPLIRIKSWSFRMFVRRLVGKAAWSKGKLKFISPQTLRRRIHKKFEETKEALKEALKDPSVVATTSDIWSAHHRAFIALTCHWIDLDTKSRFNCLLSLRQFKFNHDHKRIAKRLYKIHCDFGLLKKTSYSTTDGG